MDVNEILTHLIKRENCFPAIKLAWDSQFQFQDLTEIPKIFPSDYIREIQMGTMERHELLCHQQRKLEFWKSGFEVMVVPSIIVFQKYKTGEMQSVNLSIRNISKHLQKVTLLMDETHAFEVDVNSTRIASFASGMTVTATINFHPEDDRDYYHKLVVATKNSRFSIPVLGIGGRGLLDISDHLDFKTVPVKYLKTISVPVSNMGTRHARFTLKTDGPFRVSPEKGVVAPQDSFNLSVSFISDTVGLYEGHLHVKYENGEESFSTLKAESRNERIGLCSSNLLFVDTYMSLKSKETVRLVNESDCKLNFNWKNHSSRTQFKLLQEKNSIHIHQGDGDNLHVLEGVAVGGQEGRVEPGFTHPLFLIEPSAGSVQPHSYVELNVFFSPKASGIFSADAYCDLVGREERVQLHLSGRSLGPKFRFGFDELNFGTIFLGGGHTYEIPLENVSQIKGEIVFEEVGGFMPDINAKVEPRRMELAPGQFGAFYLFFNCGGVPREFLEELRFRIPATHDTIYITIRGVIKFPGTHFSVDRLLMGEASYGFPKTEEIVLINDSLNPVDITLRLSQDGVIPSRDHQEIIDSFDVEKYEYLRNPREFSIEPSAFQLAARGFQRVNITLLSNNYGEYNRKINAFIVGSSEPVHSLPLTAHVPVPHLVNTTPEIVLRDCYVGFPYPEKFQIYNPTELSAVYYIVPASSTSSKVTFNSNEFVGVMSPWSVTTIHFDSICLILGEAKAFLELYLVGESEVMLQLSVKCFGIPCRLDVSNRNLDFGTVNVLEPTSRQFDVMNESPLAIPYAISIIEGGQDGDHWELEPAVDVLEPHSNRTLTVNLTLQEVGVHEAVARIQITNAAAFIDVKLRANGKGCSLKFEPPFARTPTVDFGTLLTKTEKTFTCDVTNLSHVSKMLDWRHASDEPPENPQLPVAKSTKGVLAKNKTRPRKKKTVFTIEPGKRILEPNEMATIAFTTQATTQGLIEENYILWLYTPKRGASEDNIKHLNKLSVRSVDLSILQQWHQSYRPQAVKQIKFIARFENPKLTFSKKTLIFRIDASPMEETFEEKVLLRVTNPCMLPLSAIFHTTFPFQIMTKGNGGGESGTDDWSYTFDSKETIDMTINFDARHLRKDKGSLYFESTLNVFFEGHPDADTIPIRGEVYFPSVVLDETLIDFGTIINGTEAVKEFGVTNVCNFCLMYKWYIKPYSTMVQSSKDIDFENPEEASKIPSINARPGKKSIAPSTQVDLMKGVTRMSLAPTSTLPDSFNGKRGVTRMTLGPGGNFQPQVDMSRRFTRKTLGPSGIIKEAPSSNKIATKKSSVVVQIQEPVRSPSVQATSSISNELMKRRQQDVFGKSKSIQSLDGYSESIQYFRQKMYRSRMMDMVGLHDPDKEMEDELIYLQAHRGDLSGAGTVALSELIDIVPLSGVIPAGQTQKFTVVFYGRPDIHFKMTCLCFIEGGTAKSVKITGQSTKASLPKEIMIPEKPVEVPEVILPEKPKKTTKKKLITSKFLSPPKH